MATGRRAGACRVETACGPEDMKKLFQGHFYSANERYLATFGHFILNFLNLEAFYSTATKALDFAAPQTRKEWRAGAQQSMRSAELQKTMAHKLVGNEEFMKQFSDGMADRSVRLAKQTVDSAALVFAHTLLDGALSECCHISFLADPAPWCALVENRKVEVSRLKSKGVQAVSEELALEHVCQLERETMNKRLEVINALCVPRLGKAGIPTAWLKHEALRDFDLLRQRIIHGQPFLRRSVDVGEQLHFAKMAGMSLLMMVWEAYGLLGNGSIEPKSERTLLRLWAVMRREFPELVDLFQDMARGSGKKLA